MPAAPRNGDPAAPARAAFVSPETRTLELGALPLELGGTLPVTAGYRSWGTLSPAGDNCVVVCHALTGSADADRWWTRMFGPGRALDPEKDFVLCSNILGSCYGTTGPTSVDPATGAPWHGDFPAITIRDMVRAQRELAVRLGVRKVRLVVGGSLGGMQTLEWALTYPELVEAIAPMACSARHSAWCIGTSEAQRQAIYADPRWRDGRYDPADPPASGLAAARMMAMLSYRSMPSFEERFGRRPQEKDLFSVESYLRYQGRQLVDRFDAATYVTLTRAMDTHDVARGRGDLDEVLRSVKQPTLVVSIDSDVLYFPEEQRLIAEKIPGARFERLESQDGHDAFLIDVDRVSDLVAEFRGRAAPGRRSPLRAPIGPREPARATGGKPPLSLFVLGKGKVGGALLDQVERQRTLLERDYDVPVRVAGVADSRRRLFDERGIELGHWREALAASPETGPFDAGSGAALLDRLGALPAAVLVDATGGEGMEDVYVEAFRRGVHVVSSNKRPLTAPWLARARIFAALREHERHLHYETTVGASLPVLSTLRDLVRRGDEVLEIDGAMSGSLGFIASELMKGSALSLAVRWAKELGYTERDPRDDLSGLDAARKAVILARELGFQVEVGDVEVTPFVPAEALAAGSLAELYASLRSLDEPFRARCRALGQEGKALRYLLHLRSEGGALRMRVAPADVGPDHLASRLRDVEAYVAFTTVRHRRLPLVVQGAGVGGSLTAGGVLTDVFRIPATQGAL
jgi:homoserine O-acetyltransferase